MTAIFVTAALTLAMVSPSPQPKPRTPVLVELFTSEGCSSCPPADALLISFVQKQPVEGVEIIGIGEHVDYWNHIGWTDRFSSASYSQRQAAYATKFGLGSVYTPQMVVDGAAELVGSERGAALRSIAEAAKRPKPLAVSLSREGTGLLRIAVSGSSALREGEAGAVLLAVTEDNLHSDVPSGENAGRVLRHGAVARTLTIVGQIERGADRSLDVKVDLDPEWKRENLRAIAFVQERSSRRILGLASISLR